MRVGLTGGIGAGKSEVARILESLGAYIIDTDQLAREAVAPGSDGFRAIARTWPQVVRDGALDRAALASIVFADPSAREKLNAIVHPFVRRLATDREARARSGQPIVHVVPLLFETGYADRCDASIVVIAPEAQRIERIVQRDRATAEQVRARMQAQMDPDEARRRATYVIENNGDRAALREQTAAIFRLLATTPPKAG